MKQNEPTPSIQDAGYDRKFGKRSACFSDPPPKASHDLICESTAAEQRVLKQGIYARFMQPQSVSFFVAFFNWMMPLEISNSTPLELLRHQVHSEVPSA